MRYALIILTTLLTVSLLVIATAPFAVQYLASSQVRDLGLGELRIENVDFNPFTLELLVEGFELVHAETTHLRGQQFTVDLTWSALMRGHIGIEEIELKGTEIWLRESADGQWAALPPLPSGDEASADNTASSRLEFMLDTLSLADNRIHIEGQQFQGELKLPSFNLSDLANVETEKVNTSTSMKAEWGDATISISTTKNLLASRPPFSIELEVENLALNGFQGLTGLDSLNGTLDTRLEISGELSRSPFSPGGDPIVVNATVTQSTSLKDVSAGLSGDQLEINAESVDWTGKIDLSDSGDTYSLEGSLATSGLSANLNDEQLASADAIEISDLKFNSDNILEVAEINVTNLIAAATMNPNGKLDGLHVLTGAEDNQAANQDAESEPAEFDFSLGALRLDGQINFRDLAQTPVFEQSLILEEIRLGSVSSSTPNTLTDLTVRSRLDEYSRLDVDGQLAPLAATALLDTTIQITQLPLDRMTTYLERAIGYEVTTGQLDLDASVKLENQHLEAELDALLRRLQVKKATGTDIENELGMPLNAALNLVRDGDDNIRLENIKIEGDLDDPAVSARQLVIKAISKALLTGTMTYFKFALQPYGAAMMAAEMIGKQAGKVSLEPLRMTPGLAKVAADHTDYIDRLTDLMGARPQLHLMICGEASRLSNIPEPTQTLDEATATPATPDVEIEPGTDQATLESVPTPIDYSTMLMTLADQRAEAVKRLLFAQKIASDRLVICKSTINDEPDGARVLLRLD